MKNPIIKFNLSGITGSFKKPHNPVSFLTYEHIHKVALLGLLGAILGKRGHTFVSKEEPEFYRDLKDIRVSISPNKDRLEFRTEKIEYANFSLGNLKPHEEQVLINPEWDIYLYIDDRDLFEELKDRLITKNFVYNIYLGKTRHFANLDKVEIIKDYETVEINEETKRFKFDSLVRKDYLGLDGNPIDSYSKNNEIDNPFLKQIYFPIGYYKVNGLQYDERVFIISNYYLKASRENKDCGFTLKISDKNLFFF